MTQNPYQTLGITSGATQDEIKAAYRKLAKQFHPDLNPGNKSAEARFKDINTAYELVGTEEARAKYEKGEAEAEQARQYQRSNPFYHETQTDGGRYSQSFSGVDDDMLRSIFEQMGRQGYGGQEYTQGAGARFRGSSANRRGQDALYKMEVSFQDAALGAEREITLSSGKKISVKIPAGINSGTKLRFAGLGEPGVGQGPAGDAYVELNVQSSSVFKRKEYDIELELPISIQEALLGAEVKVPTIDGSVMMKIPSGISSGNKLRLSGKGILQSSTGKRGDQYVIIKLVCPTHPDEEIKTAVRAWQQRQKFDPRAGWAGYQGGMS